MAENSEEACPVHGTVGDKFLAPSEDYVKEYGCTCTVIPHVLRDVDLVVVRIVNLKSRYHGQTGYAYRNPRSRGVMDGWRVYIPGVFSNASKTDPTVIFGRTEVEVLDEEPPAQGEPLAQGETGVFIKPEKAAQHECATPPKRGYEFTTLWQCPSCLKWWEFRDAMGGHLWGRVRWYDIGALRRIERYNAGRYRDPT